MFDLDGVLWRIDSNVWIIDKNDPSKPLLKLTNEEFSLIYGGFYIEEEIKITYNNQTYFLSKEIFDRIKKKKRAIIPERLGVSFVEFTDVKFIKKIDFIMSNLKHLSNYKTHLGILTARHNQPIYGDYLNDFRNEIKRFQLELDYIYFVGDKFTYSTTDEKSKEKVKVLLQHLVGYKIQDGKFLPIKKDAFDNVHFYDDEMQNIFYANNVQETFEDILRKSGDEIHEIIMQKVKTKSLKLFNHLVTGNDINKFRTTIVELKAPKMYPKVMESLKYLQTYENYKIE